MYFFKISPCLKTGADKYTILEAEHNVVDDGLEHFLSAAGKAVNNLALFKSILFMVSKSCLAADDVSADACIP